MPDVQSGSACQRISGKAGQATSYWERSKNTSISLPAEGLTKSYWQMTLKSFVGLGVSVLGRL